MRTSIRKLLVITSCFIIAITLIACGNKSGTEQNTQQIEQNIGPNFSDLEIDERKAIAHESIIKQFGTDIVFVGTEENVVIRNGQEYYQVYYKTVDENRVQCWVGQDGTVVSYGKGTAINQSVVEYLTKVFGSKLNDFNLMCEIETDGPIIDLSDSTQAQEFLNRNDVKIRIRLIADENCKTDIISMINHKFDGILPNCNGICYVYFAPNPSQIKFDNFPFQHYDKAFKLSKQTSF